MRNLARFGRLKNVRGIWNGPLVMFCLGWPIAWHLGIPFVRRAPLRATPLGFRRSIVFGVTCEERRRDPESLSHARHGDRDENPPSENSSNQLFGRIFPLPQGYANLIDFRRHPLAVSLDGQIRAVNRSFRSVIPLSNNYRRPLAISSEAAERGQPVERAMRVSWSAASGPVLFLSGEKPVLAFLFDCVATP